MYWEYHNYMLLLKTKIRCDQTKLNVKLDDEKRK